MIDLNTIFNSAHDGQWLVFAGALLMALVQVARKLLPVINKKIPKRALPLIIFAIGVLAAGGGVLAGGGGWQAAIIAGVTVGLASLGAYDLAKGSAGSFASPPVDTGDGDAAPSQEPPSSSSGSTPTKEVAA